MARSIASRAAEGEWAGSSRLACRSMLRIWPITVAAWTSCPMTSPIETIRAGRVAGGTVGSGYASYQSPPTMSWSAAGRYRAAMSRPGTSGSSVSIAACSCSAVLSRLATKRVRSTAWLTYPATVVRTASSVGASTWGRDQHHVRTPRRSGSGTHITDSRPSESYPATASGPKPRRSVGRSATKTARCSRMARALGKEASHSRWSMALSTGRTSSGSITRHSFPPFARSRPTNVGSAGPWNRWRRRRVRSVRSRAWASSMAARRRRPAWSRSRWINSEAILSLSSIEQAAVRSSRSRSSSAVHSRGS